MNIELRTIKAMIKEWRKRMNDERKDTMKKKLAVVNEETGEWYYREGYSQGLKFALRDGKILGEEEEK